MKNTVENNSIKITLIAVEWKKGSIPELWDGKAGRKNFRKPIKI